MDNASKPLILSSSPHFHSRYTTEKAMREVVLALLPAAAAGIWFFGYRAILVMLASIAGALAAEVLCLKIRKRPITDGSAAVTGLLLALCLPPGIPLWTAFLGGVFAIVIGKQVFGGLGQNIFNPALIGRALLLASFPNQMASWMPARGAGLAQATGAMGIDAITSATPMVFLKEGAMHQLPSLLDSALGQISGSIGETSVVALLIGGAFLIVRKHIDWKIPVLYLGTLMGISLIYTAVMGYGLLFPLYQLCSGGLMLGAFYMATDWVTSPVTKKGRLVYGLGLGLMTCLIRFFGGLAEGVCYSILIMNALTPLIDRYMRGKIFGVKGKGGSPT